MVLRWPAIVVLDASTLRASATDRAAQIPRASSHKDYRKDTQITVREYELLIRLFGASLEAKIMTFDSGMDIRLIC